MPTRAGECAVLCPFDTVESEAMTTNTWFLQVTSTPIPQHSASWPSRLLHRMTCRNSYTLCATVRHPLFKIPFAADAANRNRKIAIRADE
jgi:hypothetical protein